MQGSCFLELLYHPWLAKPPAVCTKQPVAPSFCPLLTKMLLQLGTGAVPDISMLNAAQTGKAALLWSPSFLGLRLGLSFLPSPKLSSGTGFLSSQEPRQEHSVISDLVKEFKYYIFSSGTRG